MNKPIWLEYIGPDGAEWYQDEDTKIKLDAGRRYQVKEGFGVSAEARAAYMVEHDTGHWKRPDPPKAPAAVKE